ncbi:MAG: DUF2325 domain-containing protein [Rhizobiaceae bacterium]|nr:DUF2325 domain-containing protein [Rhizobiaceae bacterium]
MWEIEASVHCSIVGTCASVKDIRRLAKKSGTRLKEEASDYMVHGFLVCKTAQKCLFSKQFQKLMDKRHGGAVNRVQRTSEADQLAQLWNDQRDCGNIAAAYWAFMTSSHIPLPLRERIFGEVHMYSHLAGSSFAKKAVEAEDLASENIALREKIDRMRARKEEQLSAHSQELERLFETVSCLQQELQTIRGRESAPAQPSVTNETLMRKMAKMERALTSARVRARQAEANNQVLIQKLRKKTHGHSILPRHGQVNNPTEETDASPKNIRQDELKILYIGGRISSVRHLRRVAENESATLVHHDGGLEEATPKIDQVLPSVNCVMCPIDCVSHDACLRAKHLCAKWQLQFVPLRTSSQSAFKEAIRSVRMMRQGQ